MKKYLKSYFVLQIPLLLYLLIIPFYTAEIVPLAEHFNPIVVDFVIVLYLNLPVAVTFAPDFEESREDKLHPET